jgi:hypothetical protein
VSRRGAGALVGIAALLAVAALAGGSEDEGKLLGVRLPSLVIASDTAGDADPIPFWGAVDCDLDDDPPQDSGPALIEGDSDPNPTAAGARQGDDSHRRVTVFDGDEFFGERCELGLNDKEGPVAFYREGERRITFASFRLPDSFPLDARDWQGVLQMKQAQSADNGGGTPVLSISAFDGHWSLWHSAPGYTDEDFEIWRTPATKGVWTRIAIDATYSQDPERGRVRLYVDANGDGDFGDAEERSPEFRINTLKRETGDDDSDGLRAGESIPSHLRVGLYHNAVIPCPPPAGCSLDIDNVQVLRPSSPDARIEGLD